MANCGHSMLSHKFGGLPGTAFPRTSPRDRGHDPRRFADLRTDRPQAKLQSGIGVNLDSRLVWTRWHWESLPSRTGRALVGLARACLKGSRR